MPDQFAVSIVIPLYGRRDLTARCLESIVAHTPEDLYEVVLVDNASPDDTGALLDALEGDVTIVRNDTNLGFARACNQGADAARGRLLLFLNNDTEVTPGWLPALTRPLHREPSIGVVGARLVYPDGTIQHAGCLLVENRDSGVIECHHRQRGLAQDTEAAMVATDVTAVTGAALLVRRDVFDAVGGFDEGYWNGYEDIDLCLRARQRGWRVRYEPSALLVHHEGASGAERVSRQDDNSRRFADRWTGQFVPDLVVEGGTPVEPGVAVGADHPEPALAATLWQLTRQVAGQRTTAPRLDGSVTEALRERLWQEEERRLLEIARAGRDVCWEDEGDPDPLVTIRIPTFRRGSVLVERALASAIAQTHANLEILVIGDAADEATAEAATSTGDPRVRFVNLPRRGVYPTERMDLWRVGGVDPANLGLALASGSWIAPCDDDDELTPDHVEVLLAEARARRLEMVWSKARMETAPGAWREVGEEPLRHGGLCHGSVLYAAPLRFLRYSSTCWKMDEPADWNLWRRMRAIGVRMGFVDAVTYVHYLEAHQRAAALAGAAS